MITISTQQTMDNSVERKQKIADLKSATNSWLSYNRKILKAQVSFLKTIRDKRTSKKSMDQTASIARPFFINSLREFLQQPQ